MAKCWERRPPPDARYHTTAWQHLRKRVLAEEPWCTLRLPGCTGRSTQADHIVSANTAPELFFERRNVRGTCAKCHMKRSRQQQRFRPRDEPLGQAGWF